MSTPKSGSVRFKDDLSHTQRSHSASTSLASRYLSPPTHSQTTSLLSAQESSSSSPHPTSFNNNTLQNAAGTSSNISGSGGSISSRPKKKISSSRRFKNNNNNDNNSLSSSPSNGNSTSVNLRPQRSLVMKHRLRKINDYYEDQQYINERQDGQPVSEPLPPLPSNDASGQDGAGLYIPQRRGISLKNGSLGYKARKSGWPGSSSEPSTGEMDTEGLLNYIPGSDVNNSLDNPLAAKPARTGTGLSSYTGGGSSGHESIEMQPTIARMGLSNVDLDDDPEKATGQRGQDHDEIFKYGHDYKCEHETAEERHHPQAEHEQEEHDDDAEGSAAGGGHGIMLSKWINMLVFVLNLLAMTHLGKAAGACLEELVPKLGMSVVSIFDAMTSSSVELAVAAFALANGLVRVVQAAMLGAILNNLLLIMGLSFCVGGFYHTQQEIQADTSQTGMNLLMIVCISYVIPVALEYTFMDLRMASLSNTLNATELLHETEKIQLIVSRDIWTISKIMAFIMLILYACCLLFQYSSRHFLVTPEAKHAEEHTVHRRNVHYWFAGWAYVVMLSAQIYSAKLLVHAVESLGKQFHLNDSFVGFVLLPIVLIADLQEEVIAIKESRANRLDRTVALMIGSCMQIALLVTPLLVLLGWAIDVQLTFRFTILEAVILAGSVLIVNYLLQDNQTNWLEGALLLAAFFMCAMAFYYDLIPLEGGEGGEHGSGGGGDH
ncbi:hypothetical protein BGX27_010201 [Mortierella sp. AM989]|nr:hypothetical protein BGX27_010201 [Mortierella sp. AM989]